MTELSKEDVELLKVDTHPQGISIRSHGFYFKCEEATGKKYSAPTGKHISA